MATASTAQISPMPKQWKRSRYTFPPESNCISILMCFFCAQWFYGAQITYKIAVTLYKESILFLYLRIFPDHKFRYACYTLITIIGAASFAFTIVTIFQCTPVAAFWDKSILKSQPGSHCFDSEAFWFSYALINILLDVVILVLPIREVVKLQLPWREKAGLVAVFSLGVL